MTAPTLAVPASTSLPASPDRHAARRRVIAADRVLDIAALAIMSVGLTLFLVARHALIAISEGTYTLPGGWTWVQRTDYHVAQSKLGLLLSGAGLLLGIVAAARHAWRASEERYEEIDVAPAIPAEQPRQAA